MAHCFKVGLFWQGLCHDISKYSPVEFWRGAKYFQGNRSPQAKERELFGYSAAWLHHKGRNKHHFEYWTDSDANGNTVAVKMPAKYLAEMVCDRIAASKIYLKKDYTNSSPLNYFYSKNDMHLMHPQTAQDLERFLLFLAEKGEKYTFKRLKKYVKDYK